MATPSNQGQISQEIADSYTDPSLQPDADVSNGTVHRDLIDVSASQITTAYAALEAARQAASLKNEASADPVGLSRFALNFDVLAAPATAATGTVTFQATVRPHAPIGIPANTLVQTQPLPDGTIILYLTTAEAALLPSAQENPLNGHYEVDVPVAALLPGTASQVGVNSLTVLPNRIAGISSVVNKGAIVNAYDGDTNDALSSAVLAKTAGSLLGTPSGYAELLLRTFPGDIQSVALVGPLDPQNTRVQYGNEVDVPIVSTNAASFTALLTADGGPTTKFSATRPVISVSSVVGATNGVNYARGTDWAFNRDTGAVYGFSAQSFDALCWFPGRQVGQGVRLAVQGTYDAAVSEAQAFLNEPTVNYITGGLLVKSAQQVLVNVSVSVLAISGVDRLQLQSAVQAAIATALSAYGLGQDVLEDDLINVINAVPGVFSVVIPFTSLSTAASPANSDSVAITTYQYARAGSIIASVS